MDAFLQIGIVCTHQGIAEIPSIIFKDVIGRMETEETQIQDEKHRSCPRVAFSEDVDLPKTRDKKREMMNDLVHRETVVRKRLVLGQIVFKRRSQFLPAAVYYCVVVEYPFIFFDIIISDLSRVRVYTLEQPTMNRQILCRRKGKSLFLKKMGNP